jgi:hypothetical protein
LETTDQNQGTDDFFVSFVSFCFRTDPPLHTPVFAESDGLQAAIIGAAGAKNVEQKITKTTKEPIQLGV